MNPIRQTRAGCAQSERPSRDRADRNCRAGEIGRFERPRMNGDRPPRRLRGDRHKLLGRILRVGVDAGPGR